MNDWGTCGQFEITTENWPEPGSGVALIWDQAQTTALVPVYWFAGSFDGNLPTAFRTREFPGQGGLMADDSTPAVFDTIAAYGSLGFDTDPGFLPCPASTPTGACCLGPCECVIATETDCWDRSGTWFPDDERSDDLCGCPPRACCFADGSCVVMSTETCLSGGGIINLDPGCEPSPCDVVSGNCCLLHLDGDDFASIPDSPSLRFGDGSEMTIEFWFRLDSPRPIYHLLSKRIGCNQSFGYQIARDDAFQLAFGSGGTGVSTGYDPPVGEWVHIAVTYENYTLRIYLNGEPRATEPNYHKVGPGTAPLRLGDAPGCPSSTRFPGDIAEVRIWNIARRAGEIACSYDRRINPASPGLVGYWRFDDEAENQTFLDLSGQDNNGTLGPTPAQESEDPVRNSTDHPAMSTEHDAALISIISPDSTVVLGDQIEPLVRVQNLGETAESIPVQVKVGKLYDETVEVFTEGGATADALFPPFEPSFVGSVSIEAVAMLSEDACAANDSLRLAVLIQTDPDAPGACCTNDGSCLSTTEGNCDGVYLGNNTVCEPDPCAGVPGACCHPDGSCLQLSRSECDAVGGVSHGVGAPCTVTACRLLVSPTALSFGSGVVGRFTRSQVTLANQDDEPLRATMRLVGAGADRFLVDEQSVIVAPTENEETRGGDVCS